MAWIDANGVSLRYEVAGQGQRTLVLLHEMGGCLESWDGVVPRLLGDPAAGGLRGFRVLRYDMRGFGLSEKRREAFGIDDLTDDLAGLLDALGLDGPVALAGCAVGGAVALRFAARRPERVAAVVAMAPATGLPVHKKPETLALAQRFEAEGVRARIAARFPVSYPERYLPDVAERTRVLGRLLANDPYCYAATYRMLCALDMEDDFARIACPVLLIAGLHDATRPPEGIAQLAERLPDAQFAVIDSGHAMPILTPARVADAIRGFLNKP